MRFEMGLAVKLHAEGYKVGRKLMRSGNARLRHSQSQNGFTIIASGGP